MFLENPDNVLAMRFLYLHYCANWLLSTHSFRPSQVGQTRVGKKKLPQKTRGKAVEETSLRQRIIFFDGHNHSRLVSGTDNPFTRTTFVGWTNRLANRQEHPFSHSNYLDIYFSILIAMIYFSDLKKYVTDILAP